MKLSLWIAPVALAAGLDPQTPSAPRALTRVPQAQLAPRSALGQQDSFAASDWRERLTTKDLDARMFSFEQLAELAARDPVALRQVDEWASADDDAGLAWTARLLQRELSRAPSRGATPGATPGAGRGPGLWRIDPFSSEGFRDLERRLEELLGRHSEGAFPLWDWSAPGGTGSSHGSTVEITPQGVKVRITEEVDGKQETREYSAANLEELLGAHPELRDQIRIGRPDHGQGDVWNRLWRGRDFEWFFGAPPGPGAVAPQPSTPPATAVRTDLLGVVLEELPSDERAQLGLVDGAGLRVARVESGTIAERLGLKRGHLLLELDGQPVRSRDDVTARIRARRPQDDVRAVVLDRWGQRHELRWRPAEGRSI